MTSLPSPLPLFLRVADVAELLEVDVRTVRRGVEAGEIPARRIGNVIRIPTQAFLDWAQLPVPTDSEAAPASAATAQIRALPKSSGGDHYDDATAS